MNDQFPFEPRIFDKLEMDWRSKSNQIRTALRKKTQDSHNSLHQNPSFEALLAGTLSRRDYVQLLAKLWAFYRPLDQKLISACKEFNTHIVDFRYAPRARLLAEDLAKMGFNPELPYPPATDTNWACCRTPAQLGGILYVIEGSLLGGAVLAKAMGRSDELSGSGQNYWIWCRDHCRRRWDMTMRLLACYDYQDISELASAADATFQAMSNWMESENSIEEIEGSLA